MFASLSGRRGAARYPLVARIGLLLLTLTLLPLAPAQGAPPARPLAAPSDTFADPNIRSVWQRTDAPVAAGQATRSWLWGPGPFFTTYEPFNGTPNGNRLVQYFDKGRLEVNDPSGDRGAQWFVTSGLLVKEMVLGRLETGIEPGDGEARAPARIPVSGEDVGAESAPPYSAFAGQFGRVPAAPGRAVNAQIDAQGTVTTLPTPPADVHLLAYDEAGGHNIPDVFWRFMNAGGLVSEGGRLRQGPLFDWVYTLGVPLTEPLWTRASVDGTERWVLVQLFERRSLTYTPTNAEAWQVEMANVGRHYYNWRYGTPNSDTKDANTHTRYSVQVQVDRKRTLTVREQVTYANTTAARLPLKEVVLRAIYHHWAGAFELTGASVEGQPVTPRWRDDSNLNLPLPAPLAYGQTVNLSLEFTIRPKSFGGRHGYDPNTDLLTLGDWLPSVVPYENGGWLQFPYADIGDQGINETADYTVQFDSADNLVIGGTGTATTHTGKRWVYEAPDVRDVAYVLSSRLLNPYADGNLTRKVGNTTIRGFFLAAHRAQAGPLLDLVASALRWYGGRLTPYPYRDFVAGEMGFPTEKQWDYSQEYPQVYFIPTQRVSLGLTPGTFPWITPVHEVAHQWFYSTVGNNQLQDPWLDEALVSFLSAEYARAQRPDLYNTVWRTLIGPGVGRPVSSSLFAGYGKDETSYFRTTYDLGTVFVGEVYNTMGAGPFWEALNDYVTHFAGQRAHPADLLRIWQAHSPRPLDGVFDRYLAYR
jgi:hypothetical protein